MSFSSQPPNHTTALMRQQMYLHHLRQVQKISNRQPSALQQLLQQHRSISQLHHHNKQSALRYRQGEANRSIEVRNGKIMAKIRGMGCDQGIRAAVRAGMQSTVSMGGSGGSGGHDGSAKLNEGGTGRGLHEGYRKRLAQRIREENERMFRAISNQRSMVLPQIGGKCSKGATSPHRSQGKQSQHNQQPSRPQ